MINLDKILLNQFYKNKLKKYWKNNESNIMSMILYYSNYCESCRNILPTISQSHLKNDIHFLCIDNRIRKPDNSLYLVMSNQKEILLPPVITQVPALMLLNRGSQVLLGKQIIEYLQPVQTKNVLDLGKGNNTEPESFCLLDINNYGVSSDNYSFLDQTVESLSAKGNGGLRQLRNNVLLEHTDQIETPPDTYVPNKVGDVSLEKLEKERNENLPIISR